MLPLQPSGFFMLSGLVPQALEKTSVFWPSLISRRWKSGLRMLTFALPATVAQAQASPRNTPAFAGFVSSVNAKRFGEAISQQGKLRI